MCLSCIVEMSCQCYECYDYDVIGLLINRDSLFGIICTQQRHGMPPVRYVAISTCAIIASARDPANCSQAQRLDIAETEKSANHTLPSSKQTRPRSANARVNHKALALVLCM